MLDQLAKIPWGLQVLVVGVIGWCLYQVIMAYREWRKLQERVRRMDRERKTGFD